MLTEFSPELEGLTGSTEILSKVFEVQIESLIDLKEVGLDSNRDYAIVLTSLKPLQISVFVPLTDPEEMKAMIEKVTKEDELTEYKGIPYWDVKENDERFVILENTLVFSKHREVCENVIDTYNGTMQALTQNSDALSLLTKISEGDDQLAVYFDIEAAIATFNRPIKEELELIVDRLEGADEDVNPLLKSIVPTLTNVSEKEIAFIEQLQSANIRFQAESTDIHIKPFLKFKNESKFLEMLQEVSGELTFLGELPNHAFINAAFQGSPTLLTEISKVWFRFLPKDTPEEQAQYNVLIEQTKDFYESLGDQWSVSFNLADNPLLVFTYELKDEQKAKAYMDEVFLEKLKFTGAYPGQSILHNRVEIKSYIFPNSKADLVEEPPKDSDPVSSKWNWYYAFTEGQLIFTIGNDPEAIQAALNRKAGIEEKFSDHPSYQKLAGKLGTDNNILIAMSPVIAAKNMVPWAAKNDPDNVAKFQLLWGMLMNLPENYSVGIAAKAQDSSIGANLIISLGDFKQLEQVFTTVFQMQQRQ